MMRAVCGAVLFVCLSCDVCAQDVTELTPARQLEDLAWAKYGGKDARPNRWDELIELFEELDARLDAARRRVSAEVLGEPEEDYAGISVGYDFWMVGGEDLHMRLAAEEDEDEWSHTGHGETPDEIRENFRAA